MATDQCLGCCGGAVVLQASGGMEAAVHTCVSMRCGALYARVRPQEECGGTRRSAEAAVASEQPLRLCQCTIVAEQAAHVEVAEPDAHAGGGQNGGEEGFHGSAPSSRGRS